MGPEGEGRPVRDGIGDEARLVLCHVAAEEVDGGGWGREVGDLRTVA